MTLLAVLHRCNVILTAGLYLAGAWLVVRVGAGLPSVAHVPCAGSSDHPSTCLRANREASRTMGFQLRQVRP